MHQEKWCRRDELFHNRLHWSRCLYWLFAYIADNVSIDDNSKVYPQSYIGDNVKIGKNTIIYPGVKIYHDTVIGSNVIIHSGAVIGADGFGFSRDGDVYNKIPQMGNVVIEDDVEIGANTTIDRSVMGSTIIHKVLNSTI